MPRRRARSPRDRHSVRRPSCCGRTRLELRDRLRTQDVARVRAAEEPAPVEVLEDDEHVAAARARLVAEGRRRERRRGGHRDRALHEVPVRRRGPGEVVLEADDATRRLEGTDAVARTARSRRAASESAGGAATASATSSRSIAASDVGRQARGPRPGSRARSPSRASTPSASRPVDDAARHGIGRHPAQRHPPAGGERDGRPKRRQRQAGRRRLGRVVGPDEPHGLVPQRSLDVGGEPPAARPRERAVQVEARGERPDGGRGERGRPIRRQPPPRDPPRRAAHRGRRRPRPSIRAMGWRSANRSPGAAAIGPGEAQDRERGPVREIDRLARPAHDERVDLVRPEVESQAIAVRGNGGRTRARRGRRAPAGRRARATWRRPPDLWSGPGRAGAPSASTPASEQRRPATARRRRRRRPGPGPRGRAPRRRRAASRRTSPARPVRRGASR